MSRGSLTVPSAARVLRAAGGRARPHHGARVRLPRADRLRRRAAPEPSGGHGLISHLRPALVDLVDQRADGVANDRLWSSASLAAVSGSWSRSASMMPSCSACDMAIRPGPCGTPAETRNGAARCPSSSHAACRCRSGDDRAVELAIEIGERRAILRSTAARMRLISTSSCVDLGVDDSFGGQAGGDALQVRADEVGLLDLLGAERGDPRPTVGGRSRPGRRARACGAPRERGCRLPHSGSRRRA